MASGERKLVALLFADLSGFTALASSLDPEEVYALIRPGLDAMRRIVEEHGGSVPYVMGDGFMAVFGVPTAHEDDAERAVRAALAIRDHARALARGRGGIRFPDVHAGVNSGEVMVAPSGEPGGFSLVGDPVNVAARLADLAPPRVVLVAEQTKRRTEHAVRYGPGRGYRAKGKPRPVVAFEAIEVRSALPAGRATPAFSGGFVDRETELEALERALAATLHERRSNLLVVTAEPGAGKTRLATEFARRRPDAILLTGRCLPYGQRPLSPIAGAVQDLIGLAVDAPRAVADRYLGRWADRTLTYQARLAESLYRRAVQAAEASTGEEPELLIGLSLGRAECLIELGRHEEAAEPANAARGLARGAGDEHLEARALLALGRIESDVGDLEVARRLLTQALSSFETVGDLGGQGWAKHRLSEVWGPADYAAELRHLREAYRLFDRAGDRWGLAVAAQDLAYLLTTVGGEEFHHWYRQARRLVEGEGDLRSRAAQLRTWGYFSYYRGEHREAIRAMREARPVAIEAGDRYAEADTFLIEAMATSLVASPDDVARLTDVVVSLGRSIGSLRTAGLGLAAAARACLRQGNPSRAGRQLSAARRTLLAGGVRNEMLEVEFVEAGIHLDRGSWRRVAAPAGRGADGARASGWVLYESMGPLLAGRALLGAGRPDEAAAELERALASATASGATGTAALAGVALEQARTLAGHPPPVVSGAVAPPEEVEVEAIRSETAGLAALAAGQPEDAAAAFARAVDHWRQLGLTVWLGRALSLQAAAARRTGDRPAADRLLAQAAEVLDGLKTPAQGRPTVLSPLADQRDEPGG